jgi:hypothetical protein
MAKITEQNDKKKGDFFKTNDIVGIPFEIVEDVNANSDFRETKQKELKDGETAKQPYQIIDITVNGETKEWHLTMSALRSLRNAMSPGAATWKGQRCVVNALASGFTPTKITRLMGDYAMPKDQQQIGDSRLAVKSLPVQETMQQKTVRFLDTMPTDGLNNAKLSFVLESVFGDKDIGEFCFGKLKSEGRVMQDGSGNWRRV